LTLAGGWVGSSAWWPLAATMTNIVTIAMLVWLARAEGRSYWSLFHFRRIRAVQDLGWLALAVAIILPLALLPNIAIATLLFGNAEAALEMFLRPLPVWAATVALAFPVTIALAELPLYFGYIMPRIEAQTGRRWWAVVAPALFLSAQHVTLPLIIDWRFMVWRLFMFLPFALIVGMIVQARPSLLAYLVVLHGLLDLTLVIMLVQISF
jgi:membrane protease YdiL (CAAX protease family)